MFKTLAVTLLASSAMTLAGCSAPSTPTSEIQTDSHHSTEISRYQKSFKTIHGKKMAYIDVGEGDPIVFLHGNPTSSYLWRNIMPYMEGKGRLIAPDLIGMGDSEKLDNSGPDSYRFTEHRKYLFSLLKELGVDENVTLVVHDWGSSLGFHWANQNPDAVKAIAYMEAALAPIPNWEAFSEDGRPTFQAIRSPAGEEMILENNMFIENILPGLVLRKLTETEIAEYRRPYLEPGESRRPTLSWPREIPVAGTPSDVHNVVSEYGAWMAENEIPKLFVNSEPGLLITEGPTLNLARSMKNQTEITVNGLHFIQEDSPEDIGQALSNWYDELTGR